MTYWTLSHESKPVTLGEFQTFAHKLSTVFAAHCGTECRTLIKLSYSELDHMPSADSPVKENKEGVFLSLIDASKITEKDWKKAAYAAVWVKPNDPAKADTFARLEAKGNHPNQLTFYATDEKKSRVPDEVGSKGFEITGRRS